MLLKAILFLLGVVMAPAAVRSDVGSVVALSEQLSRRGEYAAAEAALKTLLSRADLTVTEQMLTLNALGVAELAYNKPVESEQHLRRASGVADRDSDAPAAAVARVRMNLASLYLQLDRPHMADSVLSRIRNGDLAERSDQWQLATLHGAVALRTGNLKRARQIFETELKRLSEAPASSELATTLHNLGMIATKQDHYREAIEYISRAAVMWRAMPETHPAVLSRTLLSLAVAQQHVREDEAARNTIDEAYGIANQHLGNEHPLTLRIIVTNSEILSRMGQKQEARRLRQVAERIRRQLPPAMKGDVVDISELRAIRQGPRTLEQGTVTLSPGNPGLEPIPAPNQ